MVEGPIRRLPTNGNTPLKDVQNSGKGGQSQLDIYVAKVLTAQGAPLTPDNVEGMKEIIGHIDTHRS